MNRRDDSQNKDRWQRKPVVYSNQLENWRLNTAVSEKNPFIGRHAPQNEVNLRVKHYPSDFKVEPTSEVTSPEVTTGFRTNWMDFYDKESTQTIVSIIIILNGILYVIETTAWSKSCCVHNPAVRRIIDQIDLCFLLFYTVELTFNFYVHFFWDFWTKSGWNKFDFIVILVSWIPLQNLAVIRLLRTLRLVRISGRLGPFAFIMKTLRKSMYGVATLFSLLVGFMTIYAVLGVGLFGEVSDEFDDFFTALWTLFITLNGESWPDFSAPLIQEFWYTPLYFGTFIVTVSVIILNMVIAVFIEKSAEVLRERKESYFCNRKEVQHCVLQLFNWESQNLISKLECNHAVNRVLSTSGFQRLGRPILEGRLELVRSLLQSP